MNKLQTMMTTPLKRWRVQAFLTEEHTGVPGGVPYGPTYWWTRWGAQRKLRDLKGSFAGQARFELERS